MIDMMAIMCLFLLIFLLQKNFKLFGFLNISILSVLY